jgi:alkane 1-monooxygenase
VWVFAALVPGLVPLAWLLVEVTGCGALWWTGSVATFGCVPLIDAAIGSDGNNPGDSALERLQNQRFYRWVVYLFLPMQYASLVIACWWLVDLGGVPMGPLDKLGLMATVGIVGGIAINAAHELGHRRDRLERTLSKVALAQTCYGHFFVEHNRGHHVWVATPYDPASSLLGESVYAFIPRSVTGGLRSAWRLEARRLARLKKPCWSVENDNIKAWMQSLVLFSVLTLAFGVTVLPWLIGQALIGVCLLETVNYLEHYGLRRQRRGNGRFERVGERHSWNSNTIVANVFLFNLQRHSDHHANPARRYQSLRHADQAPQLPAGYATMIALAFIPPLWRRIMDKRVLKHYGGDQGLAALSGREKRRLRHSR